MDEDIFRGYGIEVTLKTPDAFLVCRETLSRIGISSEKNGEKRLTQSCHILHKRGRYAIMHFKEMFALDDKPTNITSEDNERRNKIVSFLKDWNLVTTDVPIPFENIQVKIVPHKEKSEWVFVSKYSIGQKH